MICSLLLIFGDIQGGKHFRAKHPLIYGAANSQQTSAAPALNLENKVSTRITGVAPTFFPNGESALVMNCETDVPIDDKVNLRKEVDKLWAVFKNKVESASMTNAVIRISSPNTNALVTLTKGYGYVFMRNADGQWHCLQDEKK